jgi:hypothetical protein
MLRFLLYLSIFLIAVKWVNANGSTGSILSILNDSTINWESSNTEEAVGYTWSSLSSVYISGNGYYEYGEQPETDITDAKQFIDDFTFLVPVGVANVDVYIATAGFEFGFSLGVNFMDEVRFDFEKETCNHTAGVEAYFKQGANDEVLIAYVPGIENCAGTQYWGNSLTNIGHFPTLGNLWVSISYKSTCPEYYTNLKSDFNPILLPGSSLYLSQSNEPELVISFKLPAYYYQVTAEYDECVNYPPSISNSLNGCSIDYTTKIDYTHGNCTFLLDTSYDNGTDIGYSYSGSLIIMAKIDINVAGFNVQRTVGSPLKWRVYLTKTIAISTSINITNDATCSNNTDCNNNGCCELDTLTNLKLCNCDCLTSTRTGYNGTYCERDITPPKCFVDGTNTPSSSHTINLQTTTGGCVNIGSNWIEPVFSDNSNNVWVQRNISTGIGSANGPNLINSSYITNNSDYSTACFDVGTTELKFRVQDVPFNQVATANDFVECSLLITVVDKEKPFVDCHQCQQNSNTSIIEVCLRNKGTNDPFASQEISYSELKDYFGDDSSHDVAYPGSEAFNGFIDCDCLHTVNASSPYIEHITKTWGSWGTVRAWDVIDSNPSENFPTTPNSETKDNFTYTVTDASANSYSCNIGIIYDTSEPTCTDQYYNVSFDHTDVNNSLPLIINLTTTYNADISGIAQEPTLGLWDDNTIVKANDTYFIGAAYEKIYKAEWTLKDRANNTNTCDLTVRVYNENPCIWPGNITNPNCEDAPPTKSNCPSSSDLNLACASTSSCNGCGSWTVPDFKDDKYVARIEVYKNDILYETYDNAPGNTSTLQNQPLALGDTAIKYIAYDMHDQSVTCQFTVSISDSVAPVGNSSYSSSVDSNGCPKTETLNTTTQSISYSYDFDFNDECKLNSNVFYEGGLFGVSNVNVSSSSNSDTLYIGTHNYRFTVKDDTGNSAYCSWTVTVNDIEDPVISCNNALNVNGKKTVQISQGDEYAMVNFAATATDNWSNISDNSLVISYSIPPNSPLGPGEHNITATATDAASNFDTCIITITVNEAIPGAYFVPVLTGVIVSDISNDDATPAVFGADITFNTFINEFHALANPNGMIYLSGGDNNDNDQILSLVQQGVNGCDLSNPTCGCASDALICQQEFLMKVQFDSCNATDKEYQLRATIECTDSACTEDDLVENFTIKISASNYCWQDLADIDVTASLVTLTKDALDTYTTAYTNNAATAVFPSANTVFYNFDKIAGIVNITSSKVRTSNVTIVNLDQSFYNDSTYNHLNATFSNTNIHSDLVITSHDTWSSFLHTEENKLQVSESFFTRYTATVAVEYSLGVSRRMLLTVDSQRELLAGNPSVSREASANTLTIGTVNPITDIEKDDAKMVIMFRNCDSSNPTIESAFKSIVSKFLHIDLGRISVSVDPAGDGNCFVEVTIKQTTCPGNVDILTLIDFLQIGVLDRLSDLHVYVKQSQDIPSVITVDTSVFFVMQTPANIIEEEVTTSNVVDAILEEPTEQPWFYYIVAGNVIGIILTNIFFHICASKSSSSSKLSKVPEAKKPERRMSIADLLAATERRSSIDVGQVRLHGNF